MTSDHGLPSRSSSSVTTSRFVRSEPPARLYVSPLVPWRRTWSMPAAWSPTYSHSRRWRPSPYRGRGSSSSALVMNSGMSFSGWWYGPYVFEPRVTTASTPWVATHGAEVRLVARVRQLVEHRDPGPVPAGEDVADVARPDEAGTAGDQQPFEPLSGVHALTVQHSSDGTTDRRRQASLGVVGGR